MSEGKERTISINEAQETVASNPASLDGQKVVPRKVKIPKKEFAATVEEERPVETSEPAVQDGAVSSGSASVPQPVEQQSSSVEPDVVSVDLDASVANEAVTGSDNSAWTPVAIYGQNGESITSVLDGDTIDITRADGKSERVRLENIDASELSQGFGPAAMKGLQQLISSGKQVEIVRSGFDKHGRTLGRVLVDGKDINLEMVKQGYARPYRVNVYDKPRYDDADKASREAALGVYGTDDEEAEAYRYKQRGQDRNAVLRANRFSLTKDRWNRVGYGKDFDDLSDREKEGFFYDAAGFYGLTASDLQDSSHNGQLAWYFGTTDRLKIAEQWFDMMKNIDDYDKVLRKRGKKGYELSSNAMSLFAQAGATDEMVRVAVMVATGNLPEGALKAFYDKYDTYHQSLLSGLVAALQGKDADGLMPVQLVRTGWQSILDAGDNIANAVSGWSKNPFDEEGAAVDRYFMNRGHSLGDIPKLLSNLSDDEANAIVPGLSAETLRDLYGVYEKSVARSRSGVLARNAFRYEADIEDRSTLSKAMFWATESAPMMLEGMTYFIPYVGPAVATMLMSADMAGAMNKQIMEENLRGMTDTQKNLFSVGNGVLGALIERAPILALMKPLKVTKHIARFAPRLAGGLAPQTLSMALASAETKSVGARFLAAVIRNHKNFAMAVPVEGIEEGLQQAVEGAGWLILDPFTEEGKKYYQIENYGSDIIEAAWRGLLTAPFLMAPFHYANGAREFVMTRFADHTGRFRSVIEATQASINARATADAMIEANTVGGVRDATIKRFASMGRAERSRFLSRIQDTDKKGWLDRVDTYLRIEEDRLAREARRNARPNKPSVPPVVNGSTTTPNTTKPNATPNATPNTGARDPLETAMDDTAVDPTGENAAPNVAPEAAPAPTATPNAAPNATPEGKPAGTPVSAPKTGQEGAQPVNPTTPSSSQGNAPTRANTAQGEANATPSAESAPEATPNTASEAAPVQPAAQPEAAPNAPVAPTAATPNAPAPAANATPAAANENTETTPITAEEAHNLNRAYVAKKLGYILTVAYKAQRLRYSPLDVDEHDKKARMIVAEKLASAVDTAIKLLTKEDGSTRILGRLHSLLDGNSVDERDEIAQTLSDAELATQETGVDVLNTALAMAVREFNRMVKERSNASTTQTNFDALDAESVADILKAAYSNAYLLAKQINVAYSLEAGQKIVDVFEGAMHDGNLINERKNAIEAPRRRKEKVAVLNKFARFSEKWLTSAFGPEAKIVVFDTIDEFDKAVGALTNRQRSSGGSTHEFKGTGVRPLAVFDHKTGQVLVSPDAELHTIMHEVFGHATYAWAKAHKPELFNVLRKVLEEAPEGIREMIKRRHAKTWKPSKAQVAAGITSFEQTETYVDELFAHVVEARYNDVLGEAEESMETKAWYKKVWEAFEKLFSAICEKFIGVDTHGGAGSAQINKNSFEEVVDALARGFFKEQGISEAAAKAGFGSKRIYEGLTTELLDEISDTRFAEAETDDEAESEQNEENDKDAADEIHTFGNAAEETFMPQDMLDEGDPSTQGSRGVKGAPIAGTDSRFAGSTNRATYTSMWDAVTIYSQRVREAIDAEEKTWLDEYEAAQKMLVDARRPFLLLFGQAARARAVNTDVARRPWNAVDYLLPDGTVEEREKLDSLMDHLFGYFEEARDTAMARMSLNKSDLQHISETRRLLAELRGGTMSKHPELIKAIEQVLDACDYLNGVRYARTDNAFNALKGLINRAIFLLRPPEDSIGEIGSSMFNDNAKDSQEDVARGTTNDEVVTQVLPTKRNIIAAENIFRRGVMERLAGYEASKFDYVAAQARTLKLRLVEARRALISEMDTLNIEGLRAITSDSIASLSRQIGDAEAVLKRIESGEEDADVGRVYALKVLIDLAKKEKESKEGFLKAISSKNFKFKSGFEGYLEHLRLTEDTKVEVDEDGNPLSKEEAQKRAMERTAEVERVAAKIAKARKEALEKRPKDWKNLSWERRAEWQLRTYAKEMLEKSNLPSWVRRQIEAMMKRFDAEKSVYDAVVEKIKKYEVLTAGEYETYKRFRYILRSIPRMIEFDADKVYGPQWAQDEREAGEDLMAMQRELVEKAELASKLVWQSEPTNPNNPSPKEVKNANAGVAPKEGVHLEDESLSGKERWAAGYKEVQRRIKELNRYEIDDEEGSPTRGMYVYKIEREGMPKDSRRFKSRYEARDARPAPKEEEFRYKSDYKRAYSAWVRDSLARLTRNYGGARDLAGSVRVLTPDEFVAEEEATKRLLVALIEQTTDKGKIKEVTTRLQKLTGMRSRAKQLGTDTKLVNGAMDATDAVVASGSLNNGQKRVILVAVRDALREIRKRPLSNKAALAVDVEALMETKVDAVLKKLDDVAVAEAKAAVEKLQNAVRSIIDFRHVDSLDASTKEGRERAREALDAFRDERRVVEAIEDYVAEAMPDEKHSVVETEDIRVQKKVVENLASEASRGQWGSLADRANPLAIVLHEYNAVPGTHDVAGRPVTADGTVLDTNDRPALVLDYDKHDNAWHYRPVRPNEVVNRVRGKFKATEAEVERGSDEWIRGELERLDNLDATEAENANTNENETEDEDTPLTFAMEEEGWSPDYFEKQCQQVGVQAASIFAASMRALRKQGKTFNEDIARRLLDKHMPGVTPEFRDELIVVGTMLAESFAKTPGFETMSNSDIVTGITGLVKAADADFWARLRTALEEIDGERWKTARSNYEAKWKKMADSGRTLQQRPLSDQELEKAGFVTMRQSEQGAEVRDVNYIDVLSKGFFGRLFDLIAPNSVDGGETATAEQIMKLRETLYSLFEQLTNSTKGASSRFRPEALADVRLMVNRMRATGDTVAELRETTEVVQRMLADAYVGQGDVANEVSRIRATLRRFKSEITRNAPLEQVGTTGDAYAFLTAAARALSMKLDELTKEIEKERSFEKEHLDSVAALESRNRRAGYELMVPYAMAMNGAEALPGGKEADAQLLQSLNDINAKLNSVQVEGMQQAQERVEARRKKSDEFVDTLDEACAEGKSGEVDMSKHGAVREAFSNLVQDSFSLAERFFEITRFIRGEKREQVRDMINEYIVRPVSNAESDMARFRNESTIRLYQALGLAYAGTKEITEKEAGNLMVELNVPHAEFAQFSKDGKTPLTIGQLLAQVAMLRQEKVQEPVRAAYEASLREGGKPLTGDALTMFKRIEKLPAMIEALGGESSKHMLFLNTLCRTIEYDKSALDKIAFEISGRSITDSDIFDFPVKRAKSRAVAQVQNSDHVVAFFGPMVKQEIPNTFDINEDTNVISMFQERATEVAHFRSFGVLQLRLVDVFNNEKFDELASRILGVRSAQMLKEHVQDVLSPHLYNDGLGANQALSMFLRASSIWILGGNVGVALKQPTSISAFAHKTGWKKLVAACMKNPMSPEMVALRKELLNAPDFKSRWGGAELDAQMAMLEKPGSRLGLRRFAQGYMSLQRVGDMVPFLIAGPGLYAATINELLNQTNPATGEVYTEAEAKEQAQKIVYTYLEETQQTRRISILPRYARRGNAAMKMMMQFKSSASLFFAAEARAIRDVAATPDKANIQKLLGVMISNHIVIPALLSMASVLYQALLGEPPDDDDKDGLFEQFLDMFVPLALAGPFGGLVFLGGFVELGTSEYQRDVVTPVASAIARLGRGAKKVGTGLYDTAFGDEDTDGVKELGDGLVRLAKTVAPVKDALKVYEGRIAPLVEDDDNDYGY